MGSAHPQDNSADSADEPPLVVAIVLNYRDALTTLKCVNSVLSSTYQRLSVVIVDNSSDEALAAKTAVFGQRCVYKDNKENLGYAGGNNVGFAIAFSMGADYVLVLNNDTVVDADAIDSLVRAAEQGSHKIGALFPNILQAGQSCIGGRFRWDGWTVHVLDGSHVRTNDYGLYGPLDWIPGVAMFFPRSSLEDIGFFDERLFFYYEDVEWSLRARSKGYVLYGCLNARVTHEHSKTLDRSSLKFRTYYPVRNEIATALRWFPIGVKLLAMMRIFINSVKKSYESVLRGRPGLIKVIVKAVADGLFDRLGRTYTPMDDD